MGLRIVNPVDHRCEDHLYRIDLLHYKCSYCDSVWVQHGLPGNDWEWKRVVAPGEVP